MVFVLDASVTMSWCFEDEVTEYAESVLVRLREDAAIVPAVWPLEVANALLVGERRGRVLPTTTETLLRGLRGLSIGVDDAPPFDAWGSAISLGRMERLSLYDATYLSLALRDRLMLATQDARLREAAGRVGVPLLAPEAV